MKYESGYKVMEVDIDFQGDVDYQYVKFVQDDYNSSKIEFTFEQTITDKTIKVTFNLSNDTTYIKDCTNSSANVAYIELDTDLLAVVGRVDCQVAMYDSTDSRLTNSKNFFFYVEGDLSASGTIVPTDSIPYMFTTGANSDIETLSFDVSETQAYATSGQLAWNDEQGALSFRLNSNVVHQIGQEVYVYGKASGAISNGDVLQFSTVQGDHIVFKKAVPSEIQDKPKLIIGVATEDISNGEFGYATWYGKVGGLDTTTWSVGDYLYFDTTDGTTGQITTTKATPPNADVLIGVVLKETTSSEASNGIIAVSINEGFRLDEIHDVKLTSPSSGEVLIHNSDYWYNDTLNAENVSYDNTDSGLTSTNTKSAIDEVATIEDWNNLSLLAYFENIIGRETKFRKNSQGQVFLNGSAQSLSSTESILGQLPLNYRPARTTSFTIEGYNVSGEQVLTNLTINDAGYIFVLPEDVYTISLNNVSFFVD